MTSFSPEFALFSQEEWLQLLSGNCPRHLIKPRLRTWHLYREGTAKDGSAQVSSGMTVRSFPLPNFRPRITVFLSNVYNVIFLRVVRHIKNVREDNFTESWRLRCFLIEHQFTEHSARILTGCKLVFHPQS